MYSQPRGYYTGSSVSRPPVQYSRPSAPTPVGGTSPPVQRYQDPYNAPGSRPAPSPQPYAQFQAQPMSYQAGQSQYQRPSQPQQDNRYKDAQLLQYSRDLATRAERDKERDRIERNGTPGSGSVGAGRPMVPQVRHSVAVPTSAAYGGSAPPAQSSVVYNSSVSAPKKPSPGMCSTDASQVSGSGPVSSAVPRASGVTSTTSQAGVATADNGSVGASSFEQRAADFLARRQQIYQRQHEAIATAPSQPIQETQPPQQQDENQNKMRLEEQLRKNIAAADRERELERAEMARKLEQTAERARERELALQRRQEEEREQGRRQLQQHLHDQENTRLESERRTKEYKERESRELERAEGGRQEQQSAQGRPEGPRQQQIQERAEAERAEKEKQARERQNRERQESQRQAREKQEAERQQMTMEKERQVRIVLARASLWLHI